jgi:HPt (histidine-containing phosphotransfer) domain-containing protein
MNINIPGLDVQKGMDLYDDDEEIYFIVLNSWVNNTPASLDKLRNVTAETLSDYAITVHGVKGTSANIGAEEIRQMGLKLEEMSKAGDINGVLALNDTFLKKADELVINIDKWLVENDERT